jgi:hypothetical protein
LGEAGGQGRGGDGLHTDDEQGCEGMGEEIGGVPSWAAPAGECQKQPR